ncbi:hypothetical protein ACH5RR_018834 [Cinchona calisaya]|uniref:Uncharacterized protein n=1 Tax=Cinchona calisaya TaxID=153742 RepID=A0ABD2ZML7_9GENT
MLTVKPKLDEGYFIEKFNLGLDWNIRLKLWKSPHKILFKVYLRANFEETVIKKVEVKEGRIIRLAVDILEDKGNLMGGICHGSSSEADCIMGEIIVDDKNEEKFKKTFKLMENEKMLSNKYWSKENMVKVFDDMLEKRMKLLIAIPRVMCNLDVRK